MRPVRLSARIVLEEVGYDIGVRAYCGGWSRGHLKEFARRPERRGATRVVW
jgi:hypothetical protein